MVSLSGIASLVGNFVENFFGRTFVVGVGGLMPQTDRRATE